MTHEIGDIVRVRLFGCLGGRKKAPEGTAHGKRYKIIDIHRGIDGAYDWDDLFLEGFGLRKFCEFDFEKTTVIEDGESNV